MGRAKSPIRKVYKKWFFKGTNKRRVAVVSKMLDAMVKEAAIKPKGGVNMTTEPNIGELATGAERRDAIHVAIIMRTATEVLAPNQPVDAEGTSKGRKVGFVDPILRYDVQPGQKYWMWLYPRTVTSLRHVWTHPAFSEEEPMKANSQQVADAIEWLTDYAKECEITYSELLEATNGYLKSGESYCLGTDTPDRVHYDRREFWRNWEIVTGRRAADNEATFFQCAC
jgi:hypothetical protein